MGSAILISEMIARELYLSEEERKIVDSLIPVHEYPKSYILLNEGDIARNCYFNIKGLVRSFRITDGNEHTTAFYLEGDSIAPLASYLNQSASDHSLECLEDSVLAVLNFQNEKELYRLVPKMETQCRQSIEQEFAGQQNFIRSFVTQSPEQRYIDLMKNRPELIRRVAQYQLANYLGIKPESLSRIRKRMSIKNKSRE
jgi:CRP-like cAMP-binding protein